MLFACCGECPCNRFIRTTEGQEGLNCQYAGYEAFVTHIAWPVSCALYGTKVQFRSRGAIPML